jgi:release factor glutamine methyltransferase
MQISVALQSASESIPRLDAEVLLAHVLNKSREWLITHSEVEFDAADFTELVAQRQQGKSVAALIGRKEFFGLEFSVDENVLIPRPETELLVEEILRLKPASLLDVGCGSGCIAIAVKKNLPACEVAACDISPAALEVARKNAQQNEVEINFALSDLLAEVSGDFEIIAANLPYIPAADIEIESGVKAFEPHSALFGGETGLEIITRLLQQIAELSTPPHFVLLEIGVKQAEELEKIIAKILPTAKVEFIKDFQGIQRVAKLGLRKQD